MIKIRLIVKKEEAKVLLDRLVKQFNCTNVSGPYDCRNSQGDVRYYITANSLPEERQSIYEEMGRAFVKSKAEGLI